MKTAFLALVLAFPVLAQDADGDWDLREDAARNLTLATLEYEGAPALAVRCLNGEVAVLMTNLPAPIATVNPVEMDVAGRSPGSSWRPLGDGRSAYHPAPGIAARDLLRGGVVVLRAPNADGRMQRFSLAAPANSASIARVLQACGQPISDARDDRVRMSPSAIRWLERAQPEFPQLAASKGIGAGEVMVSCVVGGEGRLQDCRVESEYPENAGFGQETERALRRARLAVSDTSPEGALVVLSMRFRIQ